MIILKMYRGELSDHATELGIEVPAPLRPLLRPTFESQAAILGVSYAALRAADTGVDEWGQYGESPSAAELYTDGSAAYVVALRPHGNEPHRIGQHVPPGIALYYIGPPGRDTLLLQVKVVLERHFGVTLEPYSYPSEAFERLQAEGGVVPAEPTDEERVASRVLTDKLTRLLLAAIKASGGLLVRDLSRQIPENARDRSEELRGELASLKLVDSEVVVICGKTQTQTARVPSREILREVAERGLRCACGKSITDERVEEALAVTELGRTLMDKSRWLSVLLVDELLELGVVPGDILLEHQLGGDEVDCIANVSGELVLFELKDKEFNLGNAYSFGAKVGIVRPDHAVVITTEHVGGDAKEHFGRAGLLRTSKRGRPASLFEQTGTNLRYIEGVSDLRHGLSELVDGIYRRDAAKVLSRVLPLAFPDPRSLLDVLSARE